MVHQGLIILLEFTLMLTFVLASIAEEDSVPGVEFQTDGMPSNVSYIRWQGAVPDMRALVVCVHLNIAHSRGRLLPLISYATHTQPNGLSLYLNLYDGVVQMLCCSRHGKFSSKKIISLVPVFRWIHVCVELNFLDKKYTIFIENKQFHGAIDAQDNIELVIRGGGVFILGQGEGYLSDELDVHQSFEGILAGYFLAFSKLSSDVIQSFISCKINGIKTTEAVTLQDPKLWNVSGSAEFKTFSAATLCQDDEMPLVVFPSRFGFDSAVSTCRKLSGEIVVPENDDENLKLLQTMQKKFPVCSRADANAISWIGAKNMAKNETRIYQNMITQNTLTYSNVQYDNYNPNYENDCLFLDSSQEGHWTQKTCRTKACLVCSFENQIVYRFRGLSDDSDIDRQYVIHGTYNGRPLFSGLSSTIIRATDSTWELVDTLNPFLKGHIIPAGQITPVGRQTWIIEQGSQGRTVQKELLLTACNSTQYTCRDGYCIDRKFRCDLEANCPDQSDEEVCLIIKLPQGYYTNVPPPKTSSNVVSVDISVEILTMQPLDRLSMIMDFSVKIVMEWRDSRLLMRSLGDDSITNVILRPSQFWRPVLFIEDEYLSEVNTRRVWSFLTVVKQSDPLPDDDTIIDEDLFFLGSQSLMRLEEIFKLKMFCFMELEGYPFDTQTCTFTIRMMATPKNLLAFNYTTSNVVYSGPKSMGEYALEDIQILKNDLGNYSGQSIKMTIKNLSAYHVTVSYIPTVIMVVICYSTFFYHLDSFNDRIMVSLTSLLVLTTLFTQITVNTPKTAYLQLLDVWFVSAILYALFVIFLLVLINSIRINEDQQKFTPVYRFNTNEMKLQEEHEEAQGLSVRINALAKQIMPVAGALFIIGYFIAAYSLF